MFIMNSFFMKAFLLLIIFFASPMIASGVPEESFWYKFNAAAKKSWDNAVSFSSAILKSDEISNHIPALNKSYNDASKNWNEYNISSKFETPSNSTTTHINDIINNPNFLTIVIIVVISIVCFILLWFCVLPLLVKILLCILRCLGFKIEGPARGTFAAHYMSRNHPVARDSRYANAQSFAMTHRLLDSWE